MMILCLIVRNIYLKAREKQIQHIECFAFLSEKADNSLLYCSTSSISDTYSMREFKTALKQQKLNSLFFVCTVAKKRNPYAG